MAKKVARLILALCGAAVGVALVAAVDSMIVALGYRSLYDTMYTWGVALVYVAAGIFIAIIFYLLSPYPISLFLQAGWPGAGAARPRRGAPGPNCWIPR